MEILCCGRGEGGGGCGRWGKSKEKLSPEKIQKRGKRKRKFFSDSVLCCKEVSANF